MKEAWHRWLGPKHEKLCVVRVAICCMNIKFFSKYVKKKRVREKPDVVGATVTQRKLSKNLTWSRTSTESKLTKTWNTRRRNWESSCKHSLCFLDNRCNKTCQGGVGAKHEEDSWWDFVALLNCSSTTWERSCWRNMTPVYCGSFASVHGLLPACPCRVSASRSMARICLFFWLKSAHLPSHLQEYCTSSGRTARPQNWENEDDNLALVSEDSEYYPASFLLGVARMVAEWLSLAERLSFQSVSRIISFQLKLELARGVLDSRGGYVDPARHGMSTILLRCTRKRGCLFSRLMCTRACQGWSGTALIHFALLLVPQNGSPSFLRNCESNTSRNCTPIKYRFPNSTISGLSQTRALSLLQ